MKLHQLRALVAIHNAGSILEASKLLHITQPALSRSIKELEREVGFALLQRSPKGMALTEEGKRVIRHANLVVESIRRLQIEAASIQDATLGAVSIGVTSLTAMLDGVDESILAFRRKYPRVKLTITDLRPSQILQRLRDGSLDFAITSQQPLSRLSLDWEALGSIKGSVICHVSNQQQFSKSLRTLQYAHWISLDELADQASQFHQLFEANGLPVPQKYRGVHLGNDGAQAAAEYRGADDHQPTGGGPEFQVRHWQRLRGHAGARADPGLPDQPGLHRPP